MDNSVDMDSISNALWYKVCNKLQVYLEGINLIKSDVSSEILHGLAIAQCPVNRDAIDELFDLVLARIIIIILISQA
jgi:hypothetical protein